MHQFNRPVRRRRSFPSWIVIGAAINLAFALSAHRGDNPVAVPVSSQADDGTTPILDALPPGYRDWPLVSVARLGPPSNDLRAKLANDAGIRAYRGGTLPFPDGTIIARLAWHQVHSELNDSAFRPASLAQGLSADAVQKLLDESFVAGPAENVQLMIKDAKKYAATGGWGFAQFTNGKPDAVATHTCFACHGPAKAQDFVFTQYAP